ncbi:3-isopropylmalate dehydratase small subunit [Moritella sp. Urea-trap-13]|uniref:3-isopropylmalate dehydratase small subunit n=1 Tax=Moritella sp. Urea-trap-13 TaxID=2058327 RepID=UPI000C336893|nr:3-isopropylmalate dehydratase small subunit [Moritella sp. Urea-trap-13]PKH06846.1 3-isopropylmalate dehydratase small subunit [Moritella sp. Urea-trap-13]
MKAYKNHTSVAALMNRSNVDTDQIIPKQFLKKVERTGFGIHLFHDWRFLDNGDENPAFELNKPAFKGAKILVAGDNFGCGSSREHAPWAIEDFGFNTVISTSYADIFYSNCFKNGILPIRVSKDELAALMAEIEANEGVEFTIDLPAQTVTTPGGIVITIEVDEFRKQSLIEGADDISWTLKHEGKITEFEEKNKQQFPWLWTEAS